MKKISRAAAGLLVSGLLVAGGAPAADAVTQGDYTCNGVAGASAVNSATAPASMQVGDAVPVDLSSVLTVPGDLLDGLLAVGGALTGTGTGGAAGVISGPDGLHQIGAETSQLTGLAILGSNILPLTGATNFIPTEPGTYNVMAGTDAASLDTRTGLVDSSLPLNCVPVGGEVIRTITVQKASGPVPPVPGLNDSTTTVALTRGTEAYGQANTATATVTTGSLGALAQDGDVRYTVAGRSSVTVPVTSGIAKLKLPKLPAGHTYTVNADYEPGDAVINGSHASSTLRVVKDGTRTSVAAPSIRRHHAEVATVRVRSAHGATVGGKVRAILKKGTHTLKSRTVGLRSGTAKVRFGKLRKKGSYTVVARYLGTGNFKRSGGKDGFAVR